VAVVICNSIFFAYNIFCLSTGLLKVLCVSKEDVPTWCN